jgi:hypothetical protein
VLYHRTGVGQDLVEASRTLAKPGVAASRTAEDGKHA